MTEKQIGRYKTETIKKMYFELKGEIYFMRRLPLQYIDIKKNSEFNILHNELIRRGVSV